MIYLPRKEIEEQVDKLIFVWDNEIDGIEKARLGFKKLYLKYNGKFKNIEEERIVSHRLCVLEMQSKYYNVETAQKYSKELLKHMDEIEGYSEDMDTACDYCKVFNNYIETHKEYISKDELIKLYERCNYIYENFCDDDEYNCLQKLITKFNLALVKNSFSVVLSCIEAMLIHNRNDIQYEDVIRQGLDDIKKVNMDLYNKAIDLKNNFNIEKIG